jgi:lipopolysaccharide export system permease protein
MYLESEMVIWLVSGRGLRSLLSPMLRFAWPTFLAVGVLVLWVWPWSNQQTAELRDRFQRRGDLERVAPGQFQESANGLRVFFIDKESAELKEGKNVFISSSEHGKQSVTSAQRGHIESIQDEQFLILNQGQRLEQSHTTTDLKISDFKEYGTRISKTVQTSDIVPPKAISTLNLINNPTPKNLGELAWRVGLLLSCFNLLIIALSITSANHRVGRGGNLALALLTFVVYYNLINMGKSWVTSGKVQFAPLLIILHGGVFLLAMTWLSLRHNNWSLQQLLLKRAAKGDPA